VGGICSGVAFGILDEAKGQKVGELVGTRGPGGQ
jgi:hypothetical protein